MVSAARIYKFFFLLILWTLLVLFYNALIKFLHPSYHRENNLLVPGLKFVNTEIIIKAQNSKSSMMKVMRKLKDKRNSVETFHRLDFDGNFSLLKTATRKTGSNRTETNNTKVLVLEKYNKTFKLLYNFHCKGETIHPESYCNNDSMKMRQKVLSYSLFGNGTRWNFGLGPKYRETIRELAMQIRSIPFYKDWVIRIYHDSGDFARNMKSEFAGNPQVQFCNVPCSKTASKLARSNGRFLRNVALADPMVDVSCFRDLDSMLTSREAAAVQQWWLNSTKAVHIMRDHPYHMVRLLAGMWCFRNKLYQESGRQILQEIMIRGEIDDNIADQHLLSTIVFKHFSLHYDTIQHDSYHCNYFVGTMPFPLARERKTFYIGCQFFYCRDGRVLPPCPIQCRPKNHLEWTFC